MKILAIDPGYERLGIAVLEKNKGQKESLVYSECFKTNKNDLFEDRLFRIGEKINSLIEEHQTETLAIETLFFSKNTKTAMHVAETRGSIIYVAKKRGLQIKELNPMQIKLALTGDGKSDKNQIIKMVQLILKINKKTEDDEYDAIACGIACASLLR